MSTITRTQFLERLGDQALEVKDRETPATTALAAAGVDQVELKRIAGPDGVIEDQEWSRLFDAIDAGDRDRSRDSADVAPALISLLDEQATRARRPVPPAPTRFVIYDPSDNRKISVDAAEYAREGVRLERKLRHLAEAIPQDASETLREYPYLTIRQKYVEAMEALTTAGAYYRKGDLHMAGVLADRALGYTDIAAQAHRTMMSDGLLGHVGKRVAAAGVGFLEGSASTVLDMVDQGAALLGKKTGLREWNAGQYEKIREGAGEALNLDFDQISADEIGRAGGGLATGLATMQGLSRAGWLGKGALAVMGAAGVKSSVDTIVSLRDKGWSWSKILSDPALVADLAGSVAAVSGAAGQIGKAREVFAKIGLVAEAVESAALAKAIHDLHRDPTISSAERDERLTGLLGGILIKAGATADRRRSRAGGDDGAAAVRRQRPLAGLGVETLVERKATLLRRLETVLSSIASDDGLIERQEARPSRSARVDEAVAAARRRLPIHDAEVDRLEAELRSLDERIRMLDEELTTRKGLGQLIAHTLTTYRSPEGVEAQSWRRDALVGRDNGKFRTDVEAILRENLNGPLSEVLLENGSLVPANVKGQTASYWKDHPEVWEAGHVLSRGEGDDLLIITSKFRNRRRGGDLEHRAHDGKVLKERAIVIQGIAIDELTAWELVEKRNLPREVVERAMRHPIEFVR